MSRYVRVLETYSHIMFTRRVGPLLRAFKQQPSGGLYIRAVHTEYFSIVRSLHTTPRLRVFAALRSGAAEDSRLQCMRPEK